MNDWLPLAFSASIRWPPMAWEIISGLLASTVLILLAGLAVFWILLRGVAAPRSVSP